ncbi:MAG: hypothetical protein H5T86_13395, partial [Armatimonadetes bacterium]|nr:hypothetical protein [Armatimonadota bacterium]
RTVLKDLVREDRCEIAGVLYNEPQTTLIGPEATIRNICYGTNFHKTVFGQPPRVAWMLDVFGHDPNFPQLLRRSGCEAVAYARGPYKRCWGIPADRLNFPVEHWWMSPDGSAVLARLLEPGSYALGESLRSYDGPDAAWWEFADLFEAASSYTASHSQLWTLGGDFTPPLPWLPDLVHKWNERHISPKLYLSQPRTYFQRLRETVRSGLAHIPRLTRDMDPVNNGCDVSYIDTKLANRLCETMVYNAEVMATLAALQAGACYPVAHLDEAWRQLLFNAHHDALTGSESDQVYIDIVGGWREAYEAAAASLDRALSALIGGSDRKTTREGAGRAEHSASARPPVSNPEPGSSELTLTVVNTLPWRRSGVVEVSLPAGWQETAVVVVDGEHVLPAEVAVRGKGKVLRFVCHDVPAVGVKTVRIRPGRAHATDLKSDGLTIENEFYRLTMDPARGGGITSLLEKATGRDLVREGRAINDFVAHREYPELPGYGEGPWNIATTGEKTAASEHFPASVTLEESPVRVSLVAESEHVDCRRKMRVTLWTGLPVVDFETYVYDYSGENILFKVHFPLCVPGGRPVFEVGGPAVSRTYCPGDQDTAELPWTQDNAANHYVDLTAPLVLEGRAGIGAEVATRLSAGMAEIVCAPELANSAAMAELLKALASVCVTATVTWPQYRRFGDIAWDSNIPDFRIFVGSPEQNQWVADALEVAGRDVETELREWVQKHGWVVALLPDVKLGLPEEMPILVVWGADDASVHEALEHMAAQ